MGLEEAARSGLARAPCHQRGPLSLRSEPLAAPRARERKPRRRRGAWGGKAERTPPPFCGCQQPAGRVMAQMGRPARLQGQLEAVSPAPGEPPSESRCSAAEREEPGAVRGLAVGEGRPPRTQVRCFWELGSEGRPPCCLWARRESRACAPRLGPGRRPRPGVQVAGAPQRASPGDKPAPYRPAGPPRTGRRVSPAPLPPPPSPGSPGSALLYS